MKTTVERPVRTRGVSTEDLPEAVNREVFPLLLQVREALNVRYTAPFEYTTEATGAWTTVYTSDDIPEDQSWLVTTEVRASASNVRSAWVIKGLFYNSGGAAQEGATVVEYSQNASSFSVRYAVADNHFTVDVQDDGSLTVDWLCIVAMREHPR